MNLFINERLEKKIKMTLKHIRKNATERNNFTYEENIKCEWKKNDIDSKMLISNKIISDNINYNMIDSWNSEK